ncbi:hypothetical protein LCGC14_2981040, partial [marine sediment metagenome]
MLSKLELTNIQKHSHLIINFTNGINLIIGDTDAGKSCIIRAIKFLYYNEQPKKDAIRKEETKKSSVKGIFDNGITVERIKSNTVNAYILTIPGKKSERFDAIGKVVPERIKEILQTQTIVIEKDEIILNIADQIKLPFLLDKSGAFRMKLFNKLTGNDIIDKVFQGLNKDILQIGRTEKLEKENLEEGKSALKDLTKTKEICQVSLDKLAQKYTLLKKKVEKYNKINECKENLTSVNQEIKEAKLQLNGIHTIKEDKIIDLKQTIERYEHLNEQLYKIKRVKKELLEVEDKLKTTKVTEINVKDLRDKIEKLTKFQKY